MYIFWRDFTCIRNCNWVERLERIWIVIPKACMIRSPHMRYLWHNFRWRQVIYRHFGYFKAMTFKRIISIRWPPGGGSSFYAIEIWLEHSGHLFLCIICFATYDTNKVSFAFIFLYIIQNLLRREVVPFSRYVLAKRNITYVFCCYIIFYN